jgi:hypothetical protein
MPVLRTVKELARHLITTTGLSRVHLRIRKAMGGNVEHLLAPSIPDRFSAIYANGVWRSNPGSGSLSGYGSEIEMTGSVREQLPDVLRTLGTRTLLDVGCGDFNWMKEVELPCAYIGLDVVADVIKANEAAYGSEARAFKVLDATRESLPQADTVLCRDVLFHLSFGDIRRVIENVRGSGATFLMATNDSGLTLNADILSGDFRLLNLGKRPFCFPPPFLSIPDDGVNPGRVLAVWNLSELSSVKS